MNRLTRTVLTSIIIFAFTRAYGQSVPEVMGDSNQVKLLLRETSKHYFARPDSAFFFAEQAIEIAEKIDFTRGKVRGYNMAGEALRFMGEYPQALEMQYKALQINRREGDLSGEAESLGFIGFIYNELEENREALGVLIQAKRYYDTKPVQINSVFNNSNIGVAYAGLNLWDSAFFFQAEAQRQSLGTTHHNLKILTQSRLGELYATTGKYDEALIIYRKALRAADIADDRVNPGKIRILMAAVFYTLGQKDSSFYYASRAFKDATRSAQKAFIMKASELLVKLFKEQNALDSVVRYMSIVASTKDQIFGAAKLRQVQLLALTELKKQQEILQEQERNKNTSRLIALAVTLGFVLIIALILVRNIRQKQKVNTLLQRQKDEIQETLMQLKATQDQLIESEKMASLGELTAGIAHEIQNPLNFVNNFSELNMELAQEIDAAIKSGKYDEVTEIAKTIMENGEKIVHHGKRADGIVKGMLQHSRASNGTKEFTDINALASEYLALAFHGLRAKDKSFNATLLSDLDPGIKGIKVIPQEIGRVILNLITNAFYAVGEKKKNSPDTFEPTVTLTTQKIGDHVLLKVKDNGNGIPPQLLDKIFQPFFTTKAAGQGTGLGLSLSYDIVKNGHQGDIKVKTEEGEGAEFIIDLPAEP